MLKLLILASYDRVFEHVIGNFSLTISEVSLSNDFKNAHLYVIPFGISAADVIINELNQKRHLLNLPLSRNTNLKYLPKLNFVYDHSFDHAARISNILTNIEDQNSSKLED